VQVVAGELNYIDKKVANPIPSSETVKGLPIPSREIPPSNSIPVPHRLPFELSHLAGLAWLAGWPFKMKYFTHAYEFIFHVVNVDFRVFVDVFVVADLIADVVAEVCREIAELKRKVFDSRY
jgi:hypothetical protein